MWPDSQLQRLVVMVLYFAVDVNKQLQNIQK